MALDGAPVAEREQAAEPAVGGAVGRIADGLEAIGGNEARADGEADLVLLGGLMRAHDAGQRVAVGNADGGELQLRRLADHLMGMRCPAQEREVGGGDELGEGGHGHLRQCRICRANSPPLDGEGLGVG